MHAGQCIHIKHTDVSMTTMKTAVMRCMHASQYMHVHQYSSMSIELYESNMNRRGVQKCKTRYAHKAMLDFSTDTGVDTLVGIDHLQIDSAKSTSMLDKLFYVYLIHSCNISEHCKE
jgi:hypothetical protein